MPSPNPAIPSALARFTSGSFWWQLMKLAAIAFIIVTVFRFFVAQPFIVSGSSMEPAYQPSDYLIIDLLSYRFEKPQRGDVIIFRYPLDPAVFYIKRISALPGETVAENSGILVAKSATTTQTLTLAKDEYFVLGDNAKDSSDSRQWGPLQRKFIIGRVALRAWPL